MTRMRAEAACRTAGLSMIMAAGFGQAVVAASNDNAAQLAALCATCHRLDNKPNGIPPIVSLDERQIIEMMHAFKARSRSYPMMHVVSSALSDAEIAAVAGYLSGLAKRAGR